MISSIKQTKELISGWGRRNFSSSNIYFPKNSNEVQQIINDKLDSIIPRGLGRSYGDPAQCKNGSVINTSNLSFMELNKIDCTLRAGSGTKISDILNFIINQGFFLPVSPGTKNVTLGGAISADVHGKNHHCDGSFANHVERISIVDGRGDIKILFPSDKSFWAVSGGMGLVGIILEATFKLIPIKTSLMKVNTEKFEDIDSLMNRMIEADSKFKYSVAWVDSLNKRGKSILSTGEHALLKDIQEKNYKLKNSDPLNYNSNLVPSAPSFLPNGILNNFTVGIFNKTWFAKSPSLLEGELQTINSFFYPLDGINNWNRIYGPNGFFQYQFVIPDNQGELIPKILHSLREVGVPSFLTVLKRFGNRENGPLSFPLKGWTLATDLPATNSGLLSKLDEIDHLIANAGGRIYLAKDSRQSSEIFKKTYKRFSEWKIEKNKLDPSNIFKSDLSQRLEI